MNSLIRKALVFVVVMGLLAVGGWFGRKAYKRATERRLVTEARSALQKKDFHGASLALQRALQVNPYSVEASRLTADMLDAAGLPAALSWRIRTAQLQTNNMANRFAWADTALKLKDTAMAAQALRGVDEGARSTAAFHKLAGALAWNIGDRISAEKEYQEALRLEPTNQAVCVNLATVRLTSTNPAVAEAARQALEQVPTNSPLRAVAQRDLILEAASRKSWDKAIGWSKELLASPAAGYGDKIMNLRLLREANSPDYGPWMASLKADAAQSVPHAYNLGRWLAAAENPTNALRWLQSLPRNIQTNQPVPLLITDCQMALKDWAGVLALVQKQEWGEAEYYRLALESYAHHSLGQSLAAKSVWEKAFRLARNRLDRLARLNQTTAVWKLDGEQEEVLREIIARFPKEKWAADQLISKFYAAGNSREMAALAGKFYGANPTDPKLKQLYAVLALLRKTDMEKAHRLAREAYESLPNDSGVACTYGYSLLLQNKLDEAVKVVEKLQPESLKVPNIALYYGAVEAQAGHKDAAKASLALAASAKLLPEEKEVVRQAQARL